MNEDTISLVLRTHNQILADVSDESCVFGFFHFFDNIRYRLRLNSNILNEVLQVLSSIWQLLLKLKIFIEVLLHRFELRSSGDGFEE